MAPGAGNKKTKSKKGQQEETTNSQQRKITQFFTNKGGEGLDGKKESVGISGAGGSSSIKSSIPPKNYAGDVRKSTGSKAASTARSSRCAKVVITLGESDDDDNDNKDERKLPENSTTDRSSDGNGKRSPYKKENGSQASTSAEVTDAIVADCSPGVKENTRSDDADIKHGGDTPETDSGDELLSQIDIDEVISSQEKGSANSGVAEMKTIYLTPIKDCDGPSGSLELSSSGSDKKRTPTKSPKARVNKFSPIRHLQRSRSRSSSKGHPSPNKMSPSSGVIGRRVSSQSPRKSQSLSAEITTGAEGSPARRRLWSTSPYYWQNFKKIIDSVASDSHFDYLFSDDDRTIVSTFQGLTFKAQCLYVRLFQRKWTWKAMSAIKYPQIDENLESVFHELYKSGFLLSIKDDVPEIQSLLDLLSSDQLQSLAKRMKLDVSKKNKDVYKKNLLNVARCQRTVFGSRSSSSSSGTSNVIVKAALELLGETYQLEKNCRTLFSRMFILYSPPQYWEDEQEQTSNQLLKILLTDTGSMKYPQYKTYKSARIFPNRDNLIRFHEAWTAHCEIVAHLESQNWTDVVEICEQSLSTLRSLLQTPNIVDHDVNLPSFLRVYTSGSVYTRVCWLGVDGFQKLKRYSDANGVIETLLSQDTYLPHYRGRWHERIIINMKHLKTPLIKMKIYMQSALGDKHMLDAHKLTLSDRLKKLHEDQKKSQAKLAKKSKQGFDAEFIDDLSPTLLFKLKYDIPARTIEGEKFDHQGQGKSVFLGARDSTGLSTASSVELFAVDHYKSEGYSYGVHAEGSAVVSIFGLFFWEEIYDDTIPDAFHAPCQPFPLDMNFEDFFSRRKESLERKLGQMMSDWTIDEALIRLESTWTEYFETISIVTWSVFCSFDRVKSFVRAVGLPVFAKICERLLKNYRHCRSGFPDLVVWNEEKALFVEVKGPGDSLSPKQMLWIDYLQLVGAKVEVCHVVAVSNKRLRMK